MRTPTRRLRRLRRLALVPALAAAASVDDAPAVAQSVEDLPLRCVPVLSFHRDSSGFYYLDSDGSRRYDLWRAGAGVEGSGGLELPDGVKVIFRDGVLAMPSAPLCLLGRPASPLAAPRATLWWLRHNEPAACASGCMVTRFPPTAPGSATTPDGFRRWDFRAATLNGPACDAPQVTVIVVDHEGGVRLDNLGVLAE